MEERSLDALVAEIEEFEARIKPLASFRELESPKKRETPLSNFQRNIPNSFKPKKIPLIRFAHVFEGSAWCLEEAERVGFDEYELRLHHLGRRIDLYFDYTKGQLGLAVNDSLTLLTDEDQLRSNLNKLFEDNFFSRTNVFQEELFLSEIYSLLETLRRILRADGEG